jgi:hypothetical protein
MTFRWNQRMPDEWAQPTPPPIWAYFVLYLVIEGICLGLTIANWPAGAPVASQEFARTALAIPFTLWIAASAALYSSMYESLAFAAAIRNVERWHLIRRWQRQSRAGVAVLDSVILTPEPDLAERMLKLEGAPPENPGKIMALGGIDATGDGARIHRLLAALLKPLATRLSQAARSDSFDIVMQCDREELSTAVLAVWEDLALPGKPVVRWLDNHRDIGFADKWFKSDTYTYPYTSHEIDRTPNYRLLLAWHLNDDGPDAPPTSSEAAVALLLGTSTLLQEKPDLKREAWLLRQITGDADQVDRLLASLLEAEQVPNDRIHHFWHSRLKGLAQHATLGAVSETGLKVEEHALDPAIGPQAPVARWLLQALAAKMAHFGQGAQLVALPHDNEKGVALNLVVKDPVPANVPWKTEYEYSMFPAVELIGCAGAWTFAMLMSSSKTWGGFETVVTCLIAVVVAVCAGGRFLTRKMYADEVWREFGG